MADRDDIGLRVDALTRRRSFVAVPLTLSNYPPTDDLPEQAADEDDLPVLTEVVQPEVAVADAAPVPKIDEALLAMLAKDIAHAIDQQMAIELPTLIEATLQYAKDELRAGIDSTIKIAVRDFLASRQQLRLPLDDPERD